MNKIILFSKKRSPYGGNIVTNGDFSDGLTGWTAGGSGGYLSIVDGALHSNNLVAGNWFSERAYSVVTFEAKTYYYSFIARNISGDKNFYMWRNATQIAARTLTASFVEYTGTFLATAGNQNLGLFCNGAIGEFEIDNIEIREVL